MFCRYGHKSRTYEAGVSIKKSGLAGLTSEKHTRLMRNVTQQRNPRLLLVSSSATMNIKDNFTNDTEEP